MSNTISASGNRAQLWDKKLFTDAIAGMFFTKNNLMGEGENNVIQVKLDLATKKGDRLTVPLTTKLSGNGVSGDGELEGNEEIINAYSDAIVIDQIRNAVRLTGKLDEQKNAYDMRRDAKAKLQIWLQEFLERQIFMKLAGVNNLLINDVNGIVVAGNAVWSNAPDRVPNADETAGYGARYLCADYTSGAASLADTDIMTPALISRAKTKAMLANPKVLPLRVEGKDVYVMFIHPWQAYDLKQSPVWTQAQREAGVRGDMNKIFTGALGMWDGVVVYEHEYVPFLDISVAGYNYYTAAAGVQFSYDCFRALLCGRQAGIFMKANNPSGWTEEEFDYGNKTGFAVNLIGGVQKITFNSKDFGVIAVDTVATAQV